MKLTLVTPQKRMLSEVDIEELIVPAERGELDILPGHAALMTTLRTGILRVRLKGKTDFRAAAISWGSRKNAIPVLNPSVALHKPISHSGGCRRGKGMCSSGEYSSSYRRVLLFGSNNFGFSRRSSGLDGGKG